MPSCENCAREYGGPSECPCDWCCQGKKMENKETEQEDAQW